MAYELPDELKQEYHVDLTFEIKRKILGENAARLYGIDIPAQTVKLSRDRISDGG
jgi:predicted TIM-barrel fold metal-dependent hydrolase